MREARTVRDSGRVYALGIDARHARDRGDDRLREADVIDVARQRFAAAVADVPAVADALRVDGDEAFGIGFLGPTAAAALLLRVAAIAVEVENERDWRVLRQSVGHVHEITAAAAVVL